MQSQVCQGAYGLGNCAFNQPQLSTVSGFGVGAQQPFQTQGFGTQIPVQFGSPVGGYGFSSNQTINPMSNSLSGFGTVNPLTSSFTTTNPYTQQGLAQPMVGFVPSISVIERHDAFVVTAEVAGVTEKEIEVYVHHNQVTVRGNRLADTTEQQHPWQVAERHFGPFVRAVSLPVAVLANKVKAELRDGLLIIELPKITQSEGDIQRVKLNSK